MRSENLKSETLAKIHQMAKQKFRSTRRSGFSRVKAYIWYVKVLKNRCNTVGRTFCDAIKSGTKKAPKTWRGGRSSGHETFKKVSCRNIQDTDRKVNPKNQKNMQKNYLGICSDSAKFCGKGSSTVNLLPWSGVELTEIDPVCALTIHLTIDKPNPEPPSLRLPVLLTR